MVNERPDGKTDAHFGRSGALTGVKHMGREISTRGELGTDSLRSNSSGTSWLQVDRMESSEAGAAQLYGGGGGGGCGGSAGIGQEANRHGAGCEGMPEIAAVTAKAEDVQLGKFDSAGVKTGDGPHGVDTCNVAVVEAGDAAGLGKEIWPRGGNKTQPPATVCWPMGAV